MTTKNHSLPVVISRAFLLLTLLFVPLLAHADNASHSMSASVDNPHSSLAKAMPITDISEEDSKKSKPAQVRYLGAPPGLHYLPILAMFVFIMMMVFEKDEKSRQILFLPVLFSFLIYKFLFLVEENTAIDSFLRKRR